VAVVNMIDH